MSDYSIYEKRKGQFDVVQNPSHYNQGGKETIEMLKETLTKAQYEGFLLGNSLKYLSRFKHKNGTEDLKKSQWYTSRLIKEREEGYLE
jgi:hypothetical protein